MKGLVTSPAGGIIELPVKGNFKKGFGVLEYFISTHGVRKGLSDTALRTANAGYLTRRLVDVSQDVIITEDDCGDTEGIVITQQESEEMGIKFLKRIIGRYLAQDLVDSKGKTLMKAGELVTEGAVEELRDKDIDRAVIRSTINCKRSRGVCSKCYGYDLGFNKPVKMGTPVGIIAAQSIGEPGTQLTMRTFHTGGVAGQEDITQGLPRVEEIFEARPPKKKAILSEVDGKIKIESEQRTIVDENGKEVLVDNPQVKILKIYYTGKETDKYYYSEAVNEVKLSKDKKASANDPQVKMAVKDGDKVAKGAELFRVGKDKVVKTDDGGVVEVKSKYVKVTREKEKVQEMTVPKGSSVLVNDGDKIAKGDQLTEGSLDLGQLYKLKSKIDVQKYIIKEIQYVYSSQGQPLNEKHIEIIARQMFSRWMIQESGDTGLLPGEVVEEGVLSRENAKVSNGAKAERLMSGITRASLTTDSFLSSASFQETARVLIDAAISGKIDYLEGLKENVIIGCLIPAGTGYKGEKKRVKYD
jgi:DNA-directed RNA polymerase subunit beta'